MLAVVRTQGGLRRVGSAPRRYRAGAVVLGAGLAMVAPPVGAEAGGRLGEVVVTATQREQSLRDVPAAASVVHREAIETRGAENVLEAVRDTPGIGLIGQSVGGRKTLSLRGMDGKHTLFLVNGLRVIATDDWVGHSDFQYDWTPIDGVDRIEVIRGPMSVLYGSEALGGVVNVITARPAREWRGSARVSGRWGERGGDGYGAGFSVAGGLGETLRVALSGSKLDRSPVESKDDRRISELEGRALESGHALLSWQPLAAHAIDLEHRISNEERRRDQFNRSRVPILHRDTYDIERSQSIATWRADWAGAQTQLRAWESDFAVANKRSQGVAPTRPQSMDERGSDGRVGFGLGASQFVTLGFDVREETLNNAGLAGGKDSATFKALYVQDEIGLADDLLLTLGVRHDRHSLFGGETSPRAYLVWHMDERWSLRGGYGEGFRAPTLKQISPNYEGHEGPHSFYGNADVKPETSRSFEFGVVYGGAAFDWEATAFHTRVRDLITTKLTRIDPPLAPGALPRSHYLYDNVHAARIRGVETAIEWRLPHGFHVGGNAQWLDTENRATGKALNARPDYIVNARLGWRHPRWDAGLRVEHTGRQRLNDERVPAYSLVHATVGYDIDRRFRVTAGIDNLTDLRLADKSSRFNFAEAPRTVRVALHGTF
ncbi:MAG TPA: TonB-dependent receptor [Rhodocyclaceae bacterium]|nr:TonB-dependent receptor [Rhodocyclaceae bacterium]